MKRGQNKVAVKVVWGHLIKWEINIKLSKILPGISQLNDLKSRWTIFIVFTAISIFAASFGNNNGRQTKNKHSTPASSLSRQTNPDRLHRCVIPLHNFVGECCRGLRRLLCPSWRFSSFGPAAFQGFFEYDWNIWKIVKEKHPFVNFTAQKQNWIFKEFYLFLMTICSILRS